VNRDRLQTVSGTKVAISMDETLLQRLDRLVKTRSFRSRNQMVQEAVSEKISRMDKSALARECAKFYRKSEQAMADEGLAGAGAERLCFDSPKCSPPTANPTPRRPCPSSAAPRD